MKKTYDVTNTEMRNVARPWRPGRRSRPHPSSFTISLRRAVPDNDGLEAATPKQCEQRRYKVLPLEASTHFDQSQQYRQAQALCYHLATWPIATPAATAMANLCLPLATSIQLSQPLSGNCLCRPQPSSANSAVHTPSRHGALWCPPTMSTHDVYRLRCPPPPSSTVAQLSGIITDKINIKGISALI